MKWSATLKKNNACPRYKGNASRRPQGSRNQSVDAPEKISANNIESAPRRRIDSSFFISENIINMLFNHTVKNVDNNVSWMEKRINKKLMNLLTIP